MSRGPGVWQRRILDAMGDCESAYLVDLLPDGYTRAEYNALHRAATRLDEHGLVSVWHFTYGTPHVVIGRGGAGKPQRPDNGGLGHTRRRERPTFKPEGLSVETEATCHEFNTYPGDA